MSIDSIRYFFQILVYGSPDDHHKLVAHWQGKDIKIKAHPNQLVQCDGEVLSKSDIHAPVIPHAIQIVVPNPIKSNGKH